MATRIMDRADNEKPLPRSAHNLVGAYAPCQSITNARWRANIISSNLVVEIFQGDVSL
jgi:hypothetical protein